MSKEKKPSFKVAFGPDLKTAPGRLVFGSIARPSQYQNKGEFRYSANIICPLGAESDKIITAIESCGLQSFGEDWKENAKFYYRPYSYGDDIIKENEKLSESLYAGKVRFVTTRGVKNYKGEANEPPRCYLADGSKMPRRPGNEDDLTMIEQQLYDGCWCRIVLTPSSFSGGTTVKGVKLNFKGIQFLKDGDRIGARDIDGMFSEPVEGGFGDEGPNPFIESFDEDTV